MGVLALLAALAVSAPVGAEDDTWRAGAATLRSLNREGRYTEALVQAQKSLEYAQRVFGPDHPSTGISLNDVAVFLQLTGALEKALPYYQRALAIAEKSLGPEDPETSSRLANLGSLLRALGRFDEALPLVQRALAISESRNGPEHPVTANRLNTLASLLQSLGRYDDALKHFTRMLAIREKLAGPDHPDTGQAVNNLSSLLRTMGKYELALPLAQRALRISEIGQGPDHPETAIRLSNLALLHQTMGRFDLALPLFLRSLSIIEKVQGPDHPNTGIALNNVGGLHKTLGQFDQALPFYQRALAIAEKRQGAEHPATATRLNNLAGVYASQGRLDLSLPLSRRALAITERALGPDHPGTGLQLNNLANQLKAAGQIEEALPLMQRALAISERNNGADHPHTGLMLNNLAGLYSAQGRHPEALALATRSYAIAMGQALPLPVFESSASMARVLEKIGQRDSAIFFGKQAVNAWQAVRAGSAQGLSSEEQRSLIDSNKSIYKDLAAWMVTDGRLAEAEQVMAMLKHHELHQLIKRSSTAQESIDLVGKEGRLGQEAEGLTRQWSVLERELTALSAKRSSERSPAESLRLEELRKLRGEFNARLQAWLNRLQEQLASAPADAQERRTRISRTGSSLQKLVESTPGNALGLQYVMTRDELSIIFHTKASSSYRKVNVKAELIRQEVARFRTLLEHPGRDPRPAAQALYQWLLAPIEAEMNQVAPQTLILNLEDVLRYVPFAALHDGKQYLAERVAVAVHTSAGGSGLRPQPGAQWQVAALGLTEARAAFKPLPAVRAELQSIVKTQGNPAGLLPGSIALDGEFTEDRLRDALKDQLPVLHIATHFHFQPGSQHGSYLLLGDGNTLSLASIKDLNFNGVQLLVLSACETAKGGGRTDDGEEVEGLAAVAQISHAQSVMASLWSVSDSSTSALMREFYRQRTAPGSPGSARALQGAQRALIQGVVAPAERDAQRSARIADAGHLPEAKAFVTDPARPYAHPFYWAPFVLMGNWL